MKKLFIFVMVFATIFTTVINTYADNNANSKTTTITLEDALKQVANNNELKLFDKKIEIYKKKHQDALDASNKAPSEPSHGQADSLRLAKVEKLNWRLTALDIEIAKHDKDQKLEDLKQSVKNTYYNIIFVQKDIATVTQELTNIANKIKQMEIKIQMGQARQTDIKPLQMQKMSLESQISEYNRQKNNSELEIKRLLNTDLKTQIQIQDMEIPYVGFDYDAVEKRIDQAIETNFDLDILDRQIKLKELERDLIKEFTQPDDSNAIYALDMDIAELEATKASKTVATQEDLWIDYYDLLILKENINLEELNLEIEKYNYDAAIAKSGAGLLDLTTESNARIAYYKQKNTVQKAMYNYVMAAEKLNSKLSTKE